MECAICEKNMDEIHDYFVVDLKPFNVKSWICSPSCLVEFAWYQKESQEKLSKSKV